MNPTELSTPHSLGAGMTTGRADANGNLSAEDPLLTPEEVSEMLGGVPASTLKRWRTQRSGPAPLHIGRHIRYRRSAVEAWLCEKDREAADWMVS
jgi:excisionase family DNA binding protein